MRRLQHRVSPDMEELCWRILSTWGAFAPFAQIQNLNCLLPARAASAKPGRLWDLLQLPAAQIRASAVQHWRISSTVVKVQARWNSIKARQSKATRPVSSSEHHQTPLPQPASNASKTPDAISIASMLLAASIQHSNLCKQSSRADLQRHSLSQVR